MTGHRWTWFVLAVTLALPALAPVAGLAKPSGPKQRPGPKGGSVASEVPGKPPLDCRDLPRFRDEQLRARKQLADEEAKTAPDARRIKKLEKRIRTYDKKIAYLEKICDRRIIID
ncbi:MAG: hypothetical protein HY613_07335 [Candidatus Rokubacteria bacterium]|nr:hypothetical protein [Candidatus Rokubacteria bacterium]